jgi:four helix bundle protein
MAFEINQKVYRLLKENTQLVHYAKNQLGKACLSVMLNIAEGSGKFSAKDRRNFFIIARGSVFECSSLISFLYGVGDLDETVRNDLYVSFEKISRLLYTMIRNLEK